MFDTLVKLAAFGTSGVCILGIFWAGYLILNPPKQPDPERPRNLRFFMSTCIAIAIISGATSVANSWYEKKELANAISTVLESKEATELENPSPELREYIKILKKFAKDAGADSPGE